MRTLDFKEYARVARQAAAEGVVMLKNKDHALPLSSDEKIALFGRIQYDYYKSGTGSGGLVNTAYVTGIRDALLSAGFSLNEKLDQTYQAWIADHPFDKGEGWGAEPWAQEEMELSEALVKEVAGESDAAVIVLGRSAGEDHDNSASPGSYLLTEKEEAMLKTVCASFDRTIVLLNVGNIIDMKWVGVYHPSAVLYVWQSGQEGGNGVVDVLSGKVSPSGRLPDTIAESITDYPSTANFGNDDENIYTEDIYVGYRYFETFAKEKVLYPFGFGLSYTDFALTAKHPVRENGKVSVSFTVENTGEVPGKDAVLLYVEAPQGALGKPSRSLIGFAKTKELAPGDSESLTITASDYLLSSYDDGGVTGHKSSYVLEAGTYRFYLGGNVRTATPIGEITVPELVVTASCEEACAPVANFQRMKPEISGEGYRVSYEDVPLRTVNPMERRASRLPGEVTFAGDKGLTLSDVKSGKASMNEFLSQLTDEELAIVTRGEGMNSPKVSPGTGGAFGGLTEGLRHYGIPLGCCSDGPSGLRLDCGSLAFSIPAGACLASSFNEALCEEVYAYLGLELRKNAVDCLLGPGMNLHRNPLNGRNFEYFSEDPLLTGRIAAAELRGMAESNVTGTIKHFAGNNQEYRRHYVSDRVSERALRELYLKGFELAVKEGNATAVMTTYGGINGIWTGSNYDLVTTILRNEWGFSGIVMTDWWAMLNDEGSEPVRSNAAAMLRAGNDLYMVTFDAEHNTTEDNTIEGLSDGRLKRGELVACVGRVCEWLMNSPAYERSLGIETELDQALAKVEQEEPDFTGDAPEIPISESGEIPPTFVTMGDGERSYVTLLLPSGKEYKLILSLRSTVEMDFAQLPLSVFQDGKLRSMITLMGLERDFTEREIALTPVTSGKTRLTFFSRQAGLEIERIGVVPVE